MAGLFWQGFVWPAGRNSPIKLRTPDWRGALFRAYSAWIYNGWRYLGTALALCPGLPHRRAFSAKSPSTSQSILENSCQPAPKAFGACSRRLSEPAREDFRSLLAKTFGACSRKFSEPARESFRSLLAKAFGVRVQVFPSDFGDSNFGFFRGLDSLCPPPHARIRP